MNLVKIMKRIKTEKELYNELIDANESKKKILTDWEVSFLDSISQIVSDYGSLTKKQRNKLEMIYDYHMVEDDDMLWL